MQIFFSHSSHQKPLIREIKKNLPEHINAWLDEDKLIFGDVIPQTLEKTIRLETDYVLLFIDHNAVSSKWVQKELEWTLTTEKAHNRTILLPIVVDHDALELVPNVELRNRKYLKLADFQEVSVRTLSHSITSELFALICRDMQHLRNPKPKSPTAVIDAAASLIEGTASVIRKAVFPHRHTNPISKDALRNVLTHHDPELFGSIDLDLALTKIVQSNLIPGLVYDGFELYLREEHASWKSGHETSNKQKIARRIASQIRTGCRIFLDAGSTIEEVVLLLCKKIENRAINQICIATTSVNIADMISDCCVRMGFDDEFCAVRLLIPGGEIRPNTQAIVPMGTKAKNQIRAIAEEVGTFDIGVVGVNGVDLESGFTTHDNQERFNKTEILSVCERKLIVGDSSKVGIKLDTTFATFEDEVVFVTNDDPNNAILQEMIRRYPGRVELAP